MAETTRGPSPHPVRIAMQLHPQHADYSAIREAVTRAEEMGVDIVYNWDHFFPLYGQHDGKDFEAWTMLGANGPDYSFDLVDDWLAWRDEKKNSA